MKWESMLMFIVGYCFGIVTMGTFTVFTKYLGNCVTTSTVQSKRNDIVTSKIPFTLRDQLPNTKMKRCNCSEEMEGNINLKQWEADELNEVEGRRQVELQKFKRRTKSSKETVLLVNGSVPLSYPAHGVVVAPEESENIPGLKVEDGTVRDDYKVKLSSSDYGVLDISATVPKVSVEGLGTTLLTIRSKSLDHLNRQLEFVVYVNTVFDIDARDYGPLVVFALAGDVVDDTTLLLFGVFPLGHNKNVS
ncbi:beta-1,4 N-acetylgalactosaminyltransferase 1-like [Branchiostoma floridae x Branchiostoma belcheri]